MEDNSPLTGAAALAETAPEPAPAPAPAPARQDPEAPALQGDPESFSRRFPGVSMSELEGNGVFRRFCGSRLYAEDAGELYADYLAFAEAAMHSADRRAADRSARSTGGGGGRADNGLSAQQLKSLNEWNRAYPNMRMTATEFLSR